MIEPKGSTRNSVVSSIKKDCKEPETADEAKVNIKQIDEDEKKLEKEF